MKTMKLTIAAMLVLLAFVAGQVYAGMEQGAMTGQQSQSSLKASDIMDKTVKDQQGQELGTVQDLFIGEQGQVDYVILSPTGDLAQEDQLIPLPWQLIQAGEEELTATVEMQKLQDAPSITEDQMQELSSQEMQSQVRGYYGVEDQPGMRHQDQMMKDQMHQPGMEDQGTGTGGTQY